MMVLLAMTVFVLSHLLIARTGLRATLIRSVGESTYLVGYSLLSMLLLAWVIAPLLAADRIALWFTPTWAYPFAAVITLLAFLLMGIGAMSPNPFSVGFRKVAFDPARPGIVGWIRHPLLWGLTFWGIAHIPANGDWPSAVLFIGTAVFGVLGIRALDRRKRKKLGEEQWRQLSRGSSHLDGNALGGLLLGLALWGVFLFTHPLLFRADPLGLLSAMLGL